MQGIDHHFAFAAQQPRQHAVGHQLDAVRGRVLARQRVEHVLAVVHHARHRLHGLVQAAAQGHVDFLETAADGQQRQLQRQCGADQGQGGGVARGVLRQVGMQDVFAIQARIDVRGGTGQHDAIGNPQRRFQVGVSAQGRQQQRHAAGAAQHGVQVFILCHVPGVAAQLALAGGNENDGTAHGATSLA